MYKLSLLLFATTITFSACSSDGGGSDEAPDAAPQPDAALPDATQPDATSITAGLGDVCTSPADCTNPLTDICVGLGGLMGICSTGCGSGLPVTSSATGVLPIPASVDTAACQAAFESSPGTPACSLTIAVTPAHNPIMPDTDYSADFACLVLCEAGTNACPAGLSCQGGACLP